MLLRKKFWMVFTMGLVVSGCATLKPEPQGYDRSAAVKEQSRRRNRLDKISGKLRLSYQGKGESFSGMGRIKGNLPNRFRLEVRDPIGRAQYIAVLKANRAKVYYPSSKRGYIDNMSGKKYLAGILGINLSFSDLQALLLGILPRAYANNKNWRRWRWEGRRGHYEAQIGQGRRSIVAYVDPDLHNFRELHLLNATGKIVVAYNNFRKCCNGVYVAREITVTDQRTESVIEIDWNQVAISGSLSDKLFQLNFPKQARIGTLR